MYLKDRSSISKINRGIAGRPELAFQSSITEIGGALGQGEKSPGLAALSSLGSILLRRVK
jgi:hypothetical protein